MKTKLSLIILLAATLSPALVRAQAPLERFNTYTELLSPEKIYLHTDREVYCVGDTIWFKAYLENAARASEFPASNYVYVELISSLVEKNVNLSRFVEQEEVRVRVKVKRVEGTLSGWLQIPDNLNTGISTLRGYSYWMLNREPEYMFYKNVEIRNPMKDDFVDTMVKGEVKEKEKYAEIGVANPFEKTRAEKRKVDVQFLPESGRWLYGHPAVMGIRAVDGEGLGIHVNGDVFAGEEQVGRFETDAHGNGRIDLRLDAPVKELYAQVYDGEEFLTRVDLPAPSGQAAVIRLKALEDCVEVELADTGIDLPDSTFIFVHNSDDIYLQIPYTAQTHRLKVAYSLLAPGINNLALADDRGNVYAERPFFVFPDGEMPDIRLDKAEYGPREKVTASVDLPEGDWSVSVSDDGYAPVSGRGYDLVSWWYLGSELPTFVEDAPSYFDASRPLAERIAAIDNVMLTHGWRYYELPKIFKGETLLPSFGKEYSQSLSGVVKGSFRTARKSIVSFVAPSIGFSAMGQLDTTGYFALNGLDFPEGTQFLVGAVSLGGSERRFTPFLNDDIFARFHHYPSYLGKPSYSQEYKYDILKDYYNSGGEIVYSLHPSYVSVNRPTAQVNISPLPDYEFKPGQFRPEDELEPYKAMDLLTYIVTTCPPLRFADNIELVGSSDSDSVGVSDAVSLSYRPIVCRTQKIASEMSISSGWSEIIVFVNGMQSSCADIDGLTVADITAFAYIKGGDAIRFNTSVDDMLAPRSVVMIKTRLLDHDMATNVSTGKPLGWQRPKYFYSPRYEDARSRKAPEQVRATLYWEPNLLVEPGETTVFDFYTSNHKAPATIILEGMTKEGVPMSIKKKLER